jgi:hypothetical protein
MAELSPKLEIAQNEKAFAPSTRDKLVQLLPPQAKLSPLRVPSMARMLLPAIGSLPLMFNVAGLTHQPLLPEVGQVIEPETLAEARVSWCSTVWAVQASAPNEQDSVLEEELVDVKPPVAQVPVQPHAAFVNNPVLIPGQLV